MPVLYWLATVVAAYGALTVWVANVTWALRVGRRRLTAVLLATPAALLCGAPWMGASLRPMLVALLLVGATVGAKRLLAPGGPLVASKETRPALLHLILITGSAIFLVPFVWMVSTSLKQDTQLSHMPPEWIPMQQVLVLYDGHDRDLVHIRAGGRRYTGLALHLNDDGSTQVLAPIGFDASGAVVAGGATISTLQKDQFTDVRKIGPFWRAYPDALRFLPKDSDYGLVNLTNTLIISFLSVIGTLLSSSLVAYGFARMRWPGRDILFGVLLSTMMLPDAVTMMPRFLIFRSLHWVDTLLPLWAPSFFASAFNVFLLRQFFMGIPKELEEAARIDGCGYLRTYWSIMLPMVRPALAAIAIMQFLASWKDFLGPLIYISSPDKMPLSYVLQLYNSAHGGEPNLLMAATTLVTLPVIILFFFTQRYFVEGVTLTGIGGR